MKKIPKNKKSLPHSFSLERAVTTKATCCHPGHWMWLVCNLIVTPDTLPWGCLALPCQEENLPHSFPKPAQQNCLKGKVIRNLQDCVSPLSEWKEGYWWPMNLCDKCDIHSITSHSLALLKMTIDKSTLGLVLDHDLTDVFVCLPPSTT